MIRALGPTLAALLATQSLACSTETNSLGLMEHGRTGKADDFSQGSVFTADCADTLLGVLTSDIQSVFDASVGSDESQRGALDVATNRAAAVLGQEVAPVFGAFFEEGSVIQLFGSSGGASAVLGRDAEVIGVLTANEEGPTGAHWFCGEAEGAPATQAPDLACGFEIVTSMGVDRAEETLKVDVNLLDSPNSQVEQLVFSAYDVFYRGEVEATGNDGAEVKLLDMDGRTIAIVDLRVEGGAQVILDDRGQVFALSTPQSQAFPCSSVAAEDAEPGYVALHVDEVFGPLAGPFGLEVELFGGFDSSTYRTAPDSCAPSDSQERCTPGDLLSVGGNALMFSVHDLGRIVAVRVIDPYVSGDGEVLGELILSGMEFPNESKLFLVVPWLESDEEDFQVTLDVSFFGARPAESAP